MSINWDKVTCEDVTPTLVVSDIDGLVVETTKGRIPLRDWEREHAATLVIDRYPKHGSEWANKFSEGFGEDAEK